MFQTKVVEKIKTHILCLVTFFFHPLFILRLPDRSKESTRTKRDTLVLQVGGWVDGPAAHHLEKNTHAKKPRQMLRKNERNLNEGQWEDRKQWSLGVGQRRKTF